MQIPLAFACGVAIGVGFNVCSWWKNSRAKNSKTLQLEGLTDSDVELKNTIKLEVNGNPLARRIYYENHPQIKLIQQFYQAYRANEETLKLLKSERLETDNLFSPKEAEEEAKKESLNTVIPVETSVEVQNKESAPKKVAPTPDQIIAIKDQFDTIDLSDNEIVKLENFPHLNRLGTMLINNNRITRISHAIGEFLPKLHILVLTNNRLANLVDIDPLSSLPKLQFLSLMGNLVTKKPNYRQYVIHKLKHLRLLDFRKVEQKELLEADNLFSSKEAEKEANKESLNTVTPVETAVEVQEEESAPKKVAPTPEQSIAIRELLESDNLFSSKEAEKEANKEFLNTVTPVETVVEVQEEESTPKKVAPTPEQSIAIRVANVYSEEMFPGEDGELTLLNAGVRVGVGIGLGVCLGVGIGVGIGAGLMIRSYQATTRNFRQRILCQNTTKTITDDAVTEDT